MKFFLIGLGGAIGTVLRYIISGLDYKYSYGIFPISTLVVNLAGSFAIGFLWGLFEVVAISPQVRMFIFIGVLGGFTTFSTFALENFNLFRDGEHPIALLNILVSNLCGIFLVFAGYALARMFVSLFK
ncbi:MAG: fluoride efflux transporter CrcB [Candidatus Velamenicoccus archaeovorus]